VAGERGCGVTARGCGARRGRSRAGLRTSDARASGQRDKGLSSWASYWAGPYRQARYVSDGVSNLHENNKKSDTPRIRILGVSDTYPYSDTRYTASGTYPCNIGHDFEKHSVMLLR